MINLKYYPAIQMIVQEGSITAASKRMYISQPALSQTIKQVEADLGEPIFKRDARQLELTYAGQLYMETASQMQLMDQNLHARIAEAREEVHAQFSLGISVQRGLQLLPQVMPAFMRLYPHVHVHLREEGSARLERMVSEGQCDVAFVTTNDKRNHLHYVLIENEKLVLLADKRTRLAQRIPDGTPINIKEAADENFVSMGQGHSVRAIQDHLFEIHGIQPHILLETRNMEAAKGVTARAGAVFLVPSVYVPDTMADRELVHIYPITHVDYERHFYFCYRQNMYLAKYEKDLVRLVCEVLRVPMTMPD